MPWQTTPLTYPLFLAASASFAVGVYVAVRNHERPARQSARSFVWLAMTASLLSLFYCLRISSAGRPEKLFWFRMVWVAVALIGITWPAFALSYTGGVRWSRTRLLAALSIAPGLVVLTSLSGLFEPVMVDGYVSVVTDWGVVLIGDFTPVTAVFLGYLTIVYLLTTFRLVKTAFDVTGIHRRQAILLLVAGVTPVFLCIIDLSSVGPVKYLYITPLSLSITTILIGWTLVRYRLLDIVPVAREAVLAEMDDGLVVLDSDRRIVDLNRRASEILSVDEELTGDFASALLDEHPALLEALDGDVDRDLTVETADGIRHYDVNASALANDADYVYGYAVVLRDVTERRAVERRFRTLIEKTSNVVSILEPDGSIKYASPSIERGLGFPPDELRGEYVFDRIHPDDRETVSEVFDALVRGEQMHRVEFRLKHRDGTWRVVEAVGENLLDDPHIDGIVVTTRDVSAQRRYEQRLQVLNRVLRHDLLNDVNVVQGYAHLLRDRLDDPENEELLDVVLEKSTAMENLSHQARRVDQLLHGDNAERAFDVAAFAEEKVRSFRRSNPDATVSTSVRVDATVRADVLLDSALDNVLRNAVQHSDRERPSVRVSAERVEVAGERYIDIAVADDGPGIPEMDRMVLERGAETPLEHASGLGLWLVSWIVSQSDGELRIDDNEPRGSVVIIRLREVVDETEDGEPARAADAPAFDGEGQRVADSAGSEDR